jgi:Protein of unknown function (DUF1236)
MKIKTFAVATFVLVGAIVALALATGNSVAQQERGAPPLAEKMAPSGAKQPPAARHQNDEGQNAPQSRNEMRDHRTGEASQNRGRPETTGQASREDQPHRLNERTQEPKRGGVEQGPRSERNGQAPATGQGPREDRRSRAAEENRTTGQAPREEGKSRTIEQNTFEQQRARTDREESRGTVGLAGPRANINLTPEKRTRIHEAIIRERNAPRINRMNFDISVGVQVPRSVRFAALPQAIVEIEPAWRGFEYFMIGDEIVVVDPRSLEIVAIVET